MSERKSGWSREFDEPIALATDGELVILRGAANYITGLEGNRAAGMASCNRGADAGGRTAWTNDVRTDRRHASIEPQPRPRV